MFAKDYDEMPEAIRAERAVAIERRDDSDFRAIGKYRYAKYARYLMGEFYPPYANLCKLHARALADGDKA